MSDQFSFTMPAQINKGSDGEYRIWGLASTSHLDKQGEQVEQSGIDLTPVDEGRGFFNFEHSDNPEDLLGIVEGYKHDDTGLYVHGTLFKDHDRAKAVYSIMKALEDKGHKGAGFSIQGHVVERDANNPKIIKKCKIDQVALTFKPANPNTYASIMKSMQGAKLEFESNNTELKCEEKEEAIFTATQMVELISKALAIGEGYTQAPNTRTQGDALSQSTLKPNSVLVKEDIPDFSGKPMNECIEYIMEQLKKLYPQVPKDRLWAAMKARMMQKYGSKN